MPRKSEYFIVSSCGIPMSSGPTRYGIRTCWVFDDFGANDLRSRVWHVHCQLWRPEVSEMKLNSMKSFGGAILGLLLFLGITLVSSTTAQAQYPYQDQDYYRRQREREYERQQRERQRQLERQRQAQQGGWYDQYGNYHASNQGYYNQGYYNQGYYNRGRTADNYGYFGGSYNFRQTALNAGYNAGIRAGRDDRRNGRYDPYRHSDYRSAMKDYNSRYGDRSAYQQYFREAFINGYADGYRGY